MAQVEMSFNKAVHASDADNKSAPLPVKSEPTPAAPVDDKTKVEPVPASEVPVTKTIKNSLHVGDLSPDTKETDLFEFFGRDIVKSVRVCRDGQTGRSLCYGYVNFNDSEEASKAMDEKNYISLKGRPIRISWAKKNVSFQNNEGNLCIKNVQKVVDARTLYDAFRTFGSILSFKMATDENGQSKGYGFIQYEDKSVADVVIQKLNNLDYRGKVLTVQHFIPKGQRPQPLSTTEYKNLYFKNYLSIFTPEEMLKELNRFGDITSHYFSSKDKGQIEGFGFAAFGTHESAIRAETYINENSYDGDKKIFITRALSKRERIKQVEEERRQRRIARHQNNKNLNLYVKNFDLSVNDQTLYQKFSQFGNITSAVVMTNKDGLSKRFGFVCFSDSESAQKALEYYRQQNTNRTGLYVNYAQLKEDRDSVMREKFNKLNLNEGVPQTNMQMNAPPGGLSNFNRFIPPMENAKYQVPIPMGYPIYNTNMPHMDNPRAMPPNINHPPFYPHPNPVMGDGRQMSHQFDRRINPQAPHMLNKNMPMPNPDMPPVLYQQQQPGPMNVRVNNQTGGKQGNFIRKNYNNYHPQRGVPNQQHYSAQQPLASSEPPPPQTASLVPETQNSPAQGAPVSVEKQENLFNKLVSMYGSTYGDEKVGFVVSTIVSQSPGKIDEYLADDKKLEQVVLSIIKLIPSNPNSS